MAPILIPVHDKNVKFLFHLIQIQKLGAQFVGY